MKKYIVELSSKERDELQALVKKGKSSTRKIQHAQILLKADEAEGGPGWKDELIAEAFGVNVRTVERLRQRCVEEGVEEALRPRKKSVRVPPRKLDGKGEAYLCKLACSSPPAGRDRWTLRLLSDRLVALEVVETISYETVRTALKKTKSSRG